MWIISVLARPGHPDQEAVAPGEDRDQELLEHRVLAHDDLGHLGLQLRERILQALDGRDVVFSARLRSGWVAHACLLLSQRSIGEYRDAMHRLGVYAQLPAMRAIAGLSRRSDGAMATSFELNAQMPFAVATHCAARIDLERDVGDRRREHEPLDQCTVSRRRTITRHARSPEFARASADSALGLG